MSTVCPCLFSLCCVVLWVGFPFGLRGVYVCQFKRATGISHDDGFILSGPQATCRGSRSSNRNNSSIPAGICGRWLLWREDSGCYPNFREEIRLAEKFGLKYDLSQCTVYLLSGDQFRGDVSGFQELGVQIRTGNDIQMLKTPVLGEQTFMNEFYDIRKEQFELSFRAVEELQNKHVAFHLLQQCMEFCQLQYLARTAPRQFLGPLLEWYDKRYRQSFETIIGRILPEQSWRQATLPLKLGGLGLVIESIPIGESRYYRADISYLVASRFIQDVRQSLIPPLPHHSVLAWAVAVERLQGLFPNWQTDFQNSQAKFRQKEMASQVEDASHRDFQGILTPRDQLRLR